MLILGIESSCDDTSVALLDCTEKGCFVVKEKTASQIDVHQKYGGVVPEIAGRMHAEKIVPLIEYILNEEKKPDIIAVTTGPGLITGLIVGTETARTLSYSLNIPAIAVNHMSGHIHAVEIDNKKIEYPAIALIVSGGHTEIILMKEEGKYELLGATLDDAAGECFDKVAKLLSLPYPGGPQISHYAENGDTTKIEFPRPMIKSENFNFSFAGLKTSALYWLRDNKFGEITKNDFCASFEQAIIDVLISKTLHAAKKYHPKTVILAGGVAANKKLRESLKTEIEKIDLTFRMPEIKHCMDNAAMIAMAGHNQAKQKDFTNWQNLKADPNWELGR